MITVAQIVYYPIKGLSAQAVEAVGLEYGQGLPHDRRYALLHENGYFDFTTPTWQPRHNFYVLKKYEQLAALKCHYDPQTTMVTIHHDKHQTCDGRLDDPRDRLTIETFFTDYLNVSQPLRIVEAPGVMYTDQKEPLISIINLNTIRALQDLLDHPIDPIRFRGNLLIDGPQAWDEFSWIDATLMIGDVHLKVIDVIERCVATNVDPSTGRRDLNIPRTLQKEYHHCNFGIFTKVIIPGTIKIKDSIHVKSQATT